MVNSPEVKRPPPAETTSPKNAPSPEPMPPALTMPSVAGVGTASAPVTMELSERITKAQDTATAILTESGVAREALQSTDVRVQSVMYMAYWYHRLRNNAEEQARIKVNLIEYIGSSAADPRSVSETLLQDQRLKDCATDFV